MSPLLPPGELVRLVELPGARLAIVAPYAPTETPDLSGALGESLGALVTVLPYGAGDDPPGKDGLAHLWEHLSYRAVPDHASRLAAMGGRGNAWTDHSYVTSWAVAPTEKIPALLDLELERLTRRPTAAELAAELPVIHAERVERALYQDLLELGALRALLWPPAHPERRLLMGDPSTLSTIVVADLDPFYRVRPVIVWLGAEPPAAALAALDRLGQRAAADPPAPMAPSPPQTGWLEEEAVNPGIWLAWPTVPATHPDVDALRLIAGLLERGPAQPSNSRKTPPAKPELRVTAEHGRHAGVLRVVHEQAPRRRDLRRLLAELHEQVDTGWDPTEIEDVQSDLRLGVASAVETLSGRAQAVGLCLAADRPPDCWEIPEVSPALLAEVAARWLGPAPTVLLTRQPGPTRRFKTRAVAAAPRPAPLLTPPRALPTSQLLPPRSLTALIVDFQPPDRASDAELWLDAVLPELPGVRLDPWCDRARCGMSIVALTERLSPALDLLDRLIAGELSDQLVAAPPPGTRRTAEALRDHAVDRLFDRISAGIAPADTDVSGRMMREIGDGWGWSPAAGGLRLTWAGATPTGADDRLAGYGHHQDLPVVRRTLLARDGAWTVTVPGWDPVLVTLLWPAPDTLSDRVVMEAIAGSEGLLDRRFRASGVSYGWSMRHQPDGALLLADAWVTPAGARELVELRASLSGLLSEPELRAAQGRLRAEIGSWRDGAEATAWTRSGEAAAGLTPGATDGWGSAITALGIDDLRAAARDLPAPTALFVGDVGLDLPEVDVWRE